MPNKSVHANEKKKIMKNNAKSRKAPAPKIWDFDLYCKKSMSLKEKLETPVKINGKLRTFPFETEWQAMNRQNKVITALRNHTLSSLSTKDSRALANKLETCMNRTNKSNGGCGSMACHLCMMSIRMCHGTEAREILKHRCKKSKLKWVTIIPPKEHHRLGKLHKFDCAKYTATTARSIRRYLRKSLPHVIVIGGVDFSFNKNSEGKNGYWQPHVHLIFAGVKSRKLLVKQLAPFYKKKQKLKFQVDNLCGYMASEKVSDQQRQALAIAISKVLGNNLSSPLSSESLVGVQKPLTKAIAKRFSVEDNKKLPAFLKALKAKMKGKYPLKGFKSGATCHVAKCVSSFPLITYTLKSKFEQKIGRGEQAKSPPLTSNMRAELALYLDRLEYRERVVFKHVSLRSNNALVFKKK